MLTPEGFQIKTVNKLTANSRKQQLCKIKSETGQRWKEYKGFKEFQDIFKLLKAADAVLEKSELFEVFGKAGPQGVQCRGANLRRGQGHGAKDGNLTFEEAVEKVMDLEPELYEKAEAERILLYKPNATLTV